MTPAETRDATLRTVQLPDCCGNCQHFQVSWGMQETTCELVIELKTTNVDYNQLCDLHARKPDGGNG